MQLIELVNRPICLFFDAFLIRQRVNKGILIPTENMSETLSQKYPEVPKPCMNQSRFLRELSTCFVLGCQFLSTEPNATGAVTVYQASQLRQDRMSRPGPSQDRPELGERKHTNNLCFCEQVRLGRHVVKNKKWWL